MKIADKIMAERTPKWYTDRIVPAILLAIANHVNRPIHELTLADVDAARADYPDIADIIESYYDDFKRYLEEAKA